MTKASWDILIPVLPPYIFNSLKSTALTGIIMGSAPLITLLLRRWFADKIRLKGSKPFIIAGLCSSFLGTLSYSYFYNFWGLLIARMLQGSGLILFFFSSLIMVNSIIPKKRRGELFGIYTIVFIFPLLFAPLIGSFIEENFTFRLTTQISSVLILIAIIIASFLKEKKQPIIQQENLPIIRTFKKFSAALIVLFFLIFADVTILIFLPLAAQIYSIGNFTLFFSLFAFSTILTRILIGKKFDTYPKKNLIVIGFILTAFGMIILSRFTLSYLLIASVFYGIGFAIFDSNLLPYLLSFYNKNFENYSQDTVIIVYTITFDSAYLIAPIILGVFSEKFTYPTMFLITAGLIILGGINFIRKDGGH